jgi:hypothetical protein
MRNTGLRTGALEAERPDQIDLVKATPTDVEPVEPVSDRRGVVKLLAAGAAGAVAGGVLFHGQRASAADGQPVIQGFPNESTHMTELSALTDSALSVHSHDGYGIECDGNWGNALFVAAGEAASGPGWAGTLWVDGDGNWWASTVSSDHDAQWRKLAGPSTGGALHLLPSPRRVYDSRPGEPPISIGPKAKIVAATPRTIDATGNASTVDPIARAALITLTVTNTAAAGWATVWASGPWPGTSNINFATGQTIATTTVVALEPGGTFQVQSNTSTDVVIDVTGYYM